jgi:hypothetical protein
LIHTRTMRPRRAGVIQKAAARCETPSPEISRRRFPGFGKTAPGLTRNRGDIPKHEFASVYSLSTIPYSWLSDHCFLRARFCWLAGIGCKGSCSLRRRLKDPYCYPQECCRFARILPEPPPDFPRDEVALLSAAQWSWQGSTRPSPYGGTNQLGCDRAAVRSTPASSQPPFHGPQHPPIALFLPVGSIP